MVSEKDAELGSSKTHFSNQEMQRWKVKRPQKTKTLGHLLAMGKLLSLASATVFVFILISLPKKQWRIL